MVSLIALAVAVLAQPRGLATLLKGIDSVAAGEGFSGVIVIGESAGDMDFARAYGFADPGHRTPNQIGTTFATPTLTRPFTAVAVARLVQEGKVSDTATARVLAHGDTGTLGEWVERVSGQPFADYVRDHVFKWANMRNTSLAGPHAVANSNGPDLILFADALLRNHMPWSGFSVSTAGPNRLVSAGPLDIYPDLDEIVVILSNQDPPAQHIRKFLRDGFATLHM